VGISSTLQWNGILEHKSSKSGVKEYKGVIDGENGEGNLE